MRKLREEGVRGIQIDCEEVRGTEKVEELWHAERINTRKPVSILLSEWFQGTRDNFKIFVRNFEYFKYLIF
jgi:hypothetical protein